MKLVNPAPLGLSGFALTTWLLSMINAGWYPPLTMPLVLAMAFAFGGTAQFVAGLCELPRGNSFGFVAFCGFGSFWWSFALFVMFPHAGVPASFVGWYLALWGVFTFFMWFGTFTANRAVYMVFLLLWITFALLAVGEWTDIGLFHRLGGYGGLATAIAALYLAAAGIINEAHDRIVLPIGPYDPAAPVPLPDQAATHSSYARS
jgi:uncharacterized protein